MGFSADWLALREPADRAARDDHLLRQAARLAGDNPVILDLGCGTGATARALSGTLPDTAQWRLLDNDPILLDKASAEIGTSAETYLVNLADVEALPLDGVTLVTASALLDLVSEAWLSAFAKRLNVPFYAALSYDGLMRWTPANQTDEAITTAFNRHQRTDKGFGPALGPDAAIRAVEILRDAGCDVQTANSPWKLGPDMAKLHSELVDGISQAACEAGAQNTEAWSRSRREGAQKGRCVIGHVDILATPGIKF